MSSISTMLILVCGAAGLWSGQLLYQGIKFGNWDEGFWDGLIGACVFLILVGIITLS